MPDDPILDAEARLRAAMLAGDVAALDALLDDGLMFAGLDGHLVGKRADLDAHRSGRLRITQMDAAERHVVRCGDTAVVSVRMETAGTFDGVPFGGALRYTRVWCRRGDGWRVVAGQMGPVSDPG